MNPRYVIGIDPGPIVGAALIRLDTDHPIEAEAAQITAGGLWALLDGWHGAYPVVAVAAERFVVGPRAAKSSTPRGGAQAREVLVALSYWAKAAKVVHVERSAAEVKPWATDRRLDAAGLLEATKGMRHARDAARHALFCAVKGFGLTDPLSTKAGTR